MATALIIIALAFACALAAYAITARALGMPPFRGRIDAVEPLRTSRDARERIDSVEPPRHDSAAQGRVDDKHLDNVWYEAENGLQAAHVQRIWDRRLAVMADESRLFMVPGHAGRTTWDDLDTWRPLAKGMTTRVHYLRIVHNHWRRDMDNDAIAIEFGSAEDLAAFTATIPAGGPDQFDFRAILGDSAAEYDRLMLASRLRGDAERG